MLGADEAMFELELPTCDSHPMIHIVYDDDGPFAAVATFPSARPMSATTYAHQMSEPTSYRGYNKYIRPLVIRQTPYSFKKMCRQDMDMTYNHGYHPEELDQHHHNFKWGFRCPNPFDLSNNIFGYMSEYVKRNFNTDVLQSLQEDIGIQFGDLLKHANKDALRVARKWPLAYQELIISACVKYGHRATQLFETFPILAWCIYIVKNRGYTEEHLKYLHSGVNNGVSLKFIANSAGIKYILRKVDPYGAAKSSILEVTSRGYLSSPIIGNERRSYDQHQWYYVQEKMVESLNAGLLRECVDQKKWGICCNANIGIQKARWFIRATANGPRRWNQHLQRTMGDWLKSSDGDHRWRPSMSWKDALKSCRMWHKHVLEVAAERKKLEAEADKLPFPDAWFEPWEHDDWTIEYIPDRKSLMEHGERQRNCVSSYHRYIAMEQKQIYRALQGGVDKLTIEIYNNNGYHPGQILAKANSKPKPEQMDVARQWIMEHVSVVIQEERAQA